MNIIDLFLKAGLFVQIVMIILLGFSVVSWAIIFKKNKMLGMARKESEVFEDKFWSGVDLSTLYKEFETKKDELSGNEQIFHDGFREFIRLRQIGSHDSKVIIEGSVRTMRLAMNREMELLETHIPFLGTVGTISPYIGLFGTVWGIMNAFIALGEVKQATLQMVAPGIAEALIATAMGLFAAIPAVMAYNRLMLKVSRLEQSYFNFIDEFTAILNRQTLATENK